MKMIQKGLFRVCFQPITMLNRAGPQTEKWENLNGTKSLTIKMTWKKCGSPEMNFSWWDLKLKKMARAQGKIR